MTKPLSYTLRIEGLCLFIICLLLYNQLGPEQGWHWRQFLMLCLIPDIAMLGYLAGRRIGAISYNATHSTIAPFVLLFVGLISVNHTLNLLSLIWLAHIGIDRALGYGLKSTDGFAFTHLGKIGRKST